jgi:hypothetical protein
MNQTQYGRWMEFSEALAIRGYAGKTEARRLRIKEEALDIIREICDVPGSRDWKTINDWMDICDEVSEMLMKCEPPWDPWQRNRQYERRERGEGKITFGDQVQACVRAGFDIAVAPSGGVVGFTVGDLRRMFPDGIPDWVLEGFDPPITEASPDSDGVWL